MRIFSGLGTGMLIAVLFSGCNHAVERMSYDQPGCVSADTGAGDATVQYCDQYRLESDDAIDPVADCLIALGYHGRSDDGKSVIYSTWQDIEWCAAQTERTTA